MSENATFLMWFVMKILRQMIWAHGKQKVTIILLHKIIRVMVSESLGLLRYIQPLCIIILIIQLTGTKSTYFKLKDGRVEVIDNKQKTTSRFFALLDNIMCMVHINFSKGLLLAYKVNFSIKFFQNFISIIFYC